MLPYTENEICKLYRNAKDKKLQLQILADMNLTDKAVVKEILEKNGYKVEVSATLPKPKQKRRYLSPEEKQRRIEQCRYYSELGYTARQAAAAMGMHDEYWLRIWAAKNGIEFAYSHQYIEQQLAREKKKAAR